MSAERRLKKTHATMMMALYRQGQELQQQLQETQEAIDAQLIEWAPSYGVDPESQLHVEVRSDGSYLVVVPAPAEETTEEPVTEEEE